MVRSRTTGVLLLLLAAGMALAAALGPLGLGLVQFRISPDMHNQLVGGEIASLFLAAPLAAGAGVGLLRGRPRAPLAALGPALYAVYTYVQFVAGPEYARYPGNNEHFFPLYLALVVLGWTAALGAWRVLAAAPAPHLPPHLGRTLGALLLGVNALFALAWAGSIAAALAAAPPPAAYRLDTTLFWLVRLMDLGFVIPAGLMVGAGLVRRAAWATRPAYALAGFQALLLASVAGMAVRMALRHDPAADPVLLVLSAAFALSFAAAWLALWRNAGARV